MSESEHKESDQVAQRRANFEALQRLGVDPYPHAFARTHTVSELVSAYGGRTGDELTAERVETRTAGRILAIRSFGKANFIAISDGESQIQAYIRQDSVSERDFAIFKLLDFGDFVGVEGYLFRTRTNELTIHVIEARVSGQVLPAAAGEMARPERHRDPVPAALPRSHRQSRLAAGVRGAQPRPREHAGIPECARLPRGRDADDAADPRRRAGPARS